MNSTLKTRYGSVAQSFHWITVVLVGTAYLLGEGGPESRVYSADRAGTLVWHETAGMLVIAVLVLRLLWRLLDRAPQEPPMPSWMLHASKAMHWLLYAILVAIPLTAITGAWYLGHPVNFLGFGAIGAPLSPSPDLGHTLTEVHTTLGSLIV